ncbi:MAG: folate-binding protein YgfZ [Thiotrichaceae bacterium]|nr:folate-binding protein YgfZ [Thiotrichaceae bacterium]
MLKQWQHVLIQTGAEFTDDQLISYGNPNRERRIMPQGNVICDLSHLGIIRITGEEAEDFLQAQLTNDIKQLSPNQAQSSAWCNPKGRVIASCIVVKTKDSYLLSLSADLIPYVLKRLKMYVMRAKVTLEDVSNNLVHFGFSGSRIHRDWDACCDGKLANNDYGVSYFEDLPIIRIPSTTPRFVTMGHLETATKLWNKLNVRAAPVGHEAWEYLNILSGLPTITEASREKWIPQMLNLQVLNTVNFQKGCFPGQEVVARLKYLGKTKRRLYRLITTTDQLAITGDTINNSAGENAGTILNTVLNPDGKLELLAIVKIAMAEETLFLSKDKEVCLEIAELPYTTEEST